MLEANVLPFYLYILVLCGPEGILAESGQRCWESAAVVGAEGLVSRLGVLCGQDLMSALDSGPFCTTNSKNNIKMYTALGT